MISSRQLNNKENLLLVKNHKRDNEYALIFIKRLFILESLEGNRLSAIFQKHLICAILWAHLREEQHILNRGLVQHHHA